MPVSRWKSSFAIRPRVTRTTLGVSPVPTGRRGAFTVYEPALSLTEYLPALVVFTWATILPPRLN